MGTCQCTMTGKSVTLSESCDCRSSVISRSTWAAGTCFCRILDGIHDLFHEPHPLHSSLHLFFRGKRVVADPPDNDRMWPPTPSSSNSWCDIGSTTALSVVCPRGLRSDCSHSCDGVVHGCGQGHLDAQLVGTPPGALASIPLAAGTVPPPGSTRKQHGKNGRFKICAFPSMKSVNQNSLFQLPTPTHTPPSLSPPLPPSPQPTTTTRRQFCSRLLTSVWVTSCTRPQLLTCQCMLMAHLEPPGGGESDASVRGGATNS